MAVIHSIKGKKEGAIENRSLDFCISRFCPSVLHVYSTGSVSPPSTPMDVTGVFHGRAI